MALLGTFSPLVRVKTSTDRPQNDYYDPSIVAAQPVLALCQHQALLAAAPRRDGPALLLARVVREQLRDPRRATPDHLAALDHAQDGRHHGRHRPHLPAGGKNTDGPHTPKRVRYERAEVRETEANVCEQCGSERVCVRVCEWVTGEGGHQRAPKARFYTVVEPCPAVLSFYLLTQVRLLPVTH